MTTRDIELSFQEIWKLFHETDRQIKATGRQLQRTDQELRDLFAASWARSPELSLMKTPINMLIVKGCL